jgi:uncharacterized protein YejL (UPF0352 family)
VGCVVHFTRRICALEGHLTRPELSLMKLGRSGNLAKNLPR